MRETKFTPGPWGAYEGLIDDEGVWIMSTHVEDAVVASIGMDLPEAKANARLIAAAPALYEALEALKPYLSTEAQMLDAASLNEGRAGGFDVASVKARAALALVDVPQTEEAK